MQRGGSEQIASPGEAATLDRIWNLVAVSAAAGLLGTRCYSRVD